MKGKFKSMWRVAIALMLVLGLSLVAAVPVAAVHSTPGIIYVDVAWDGTEDGGVATPFNTIGEAIDHATAGDTINVLPGTYELSGTLTIATDGVTLQATGTAAETIIDANEQNDAISITGNDVTVDGFTIQDVVVFGIRVTGSDGAIVRNIIITAIGSEITGITTEAAGGIATNTTISGNTLNNALIYLGPSSGNRVLNNTSSTIDIENTASDNDIIGNTLTDIVSRGIKLVGAGAHNDTLIQDNTISRNTDYGIHVLAEVTSVANLVITGNTITDNGIAGIRIEDVTWGAGNTINNNNISGNALFGIDNLSSGTDIDAENNWWGDATGPYHASTNLHGFGDAVNEEVDYFPWLLSPFLVATDLELDAEYYHIDGTVEVTVEATDANTNTIKKDEVTGTAVSVTDTVGIEVTLEETGVNTGVFEGSFTLVAPDPEPGAGELGVEDGDLITVTFGGHVKTAEVDDTAPTIDVLTPADGAQIEDTTPTIEATYEDDPDVSGIDADSVEMFFDGVDVTDDATVEETSVSYTPEDDLVDGSYDVVVKVSDDAGNEATKSWSFRVVSWLEGPINGEDEDALDTVGVAVFDADGADILVGRFASNPEPDAPSPLFMIEDGFFDVQVTDAHGATEIVIIFAGPEITAETTAYVWSELQGEWLECSDQGYSVSNEWLWVKVRTTTTPSIAELTGTPFAISGEEAVDILAYYRAYSGESEVVDTADLLKAANDWTNGVVPPDFTEAITTTQLLVLANEWAATE